MRVLDLFSGIGGQTLLLPVPHTTVLYVEKDPFCQCVLQQRMADGSLPLAPLYPDISNLQATHPAFCDPIDLVCGGFPCQDISCQGVQRGFSSGGKQKRSILFFEIVRMVGELKPKKIWLENVESILSQPNVWWPIISTLHDIGYNLVWVLIGACDVGAPHRRKRWFLLGQCRTSSDTIPMAALKRGDFPTQHLPRSGGVINAVPYLDWHSPSTPRWDRATDFTRRIVNPLNNVVVRTIHRWTTPRATPAGAASVTLTRRTSNDLGTQIRFAHDTPSDVARFGESRMVTNPDWVEWLMGFPIGWSDPVPRKCEAVSWKEEPDIPKLVTSCHQTRMRNIALGNACVPQCASLAWKLLHQYISSSV